MLSSKENSDYGKLKVIKFLISFFFIIFSETTVKLISDNLYNNIYIIIIPIISFLILYVILFKKLNFKFK